MGFPAVEQATTNMSLLPKAGTCLVRRLQTLCLLVADLEKAEKAQQASRGKASQGPEGKAETFLTKTFEHN